MVLLLTSTSSSKWEVKFERANTHFFFEGYDARAMCFALSLFYISTNPQSRNYSRCCAKSTRARGLIIWYVFFYTALLFCLNKALRQGLQRVLLDLKIRATAVFVLHASVNNLGFYFCTFRRVCKVSSRGSEFTFLVSVDFGELQATVRDRRPSHAESWFQTTRRRFSRRILLLVIFMRAIISNAIEIPSRGTVRHGMVRV